MTNQRVSWLHPGYVVASGETAAPAVVVEEVRLRAELQTAGAKKRSKPDAEAETEARNDDGPENFDFAEEES